MTPSADARGIHRRPSRPCPQHLVDVHDHLRGELAQLRDIVDQVRRGALSIGRGAVGDQHDDDAPEQLDARRLLRVLLPHRHRAPHPRGPQHLPPPAPREPDLGPVIDRLEEEHDVIADVLEQVDHALVGLVGTDAYGRAGEAALDEIQRALDLLTDTLLSHLAYEERELLHPLARHGFG